MSNFEWVYEVGQVFSGIDFTLDVAGYVGSEDDVFKIVERDTDEENNQFYLLENEEKNARFEVPLVLIEVPCIKLLQKEG